MEIKLSPLEIDFISDVAASEHDLWELYQFVRHHHPDAAESEVISIGRQLLNDWVARGWLKANRPHSEEILDGRAIIQFVENLGNAVAEPIPDTIELTLTQKAHNDVEFLRGLKAIPSYTKP